MWMDDLCQEADAEGASSVRAASIQAMTLLIGSYEAAKSIADLAAMDVVEVFSPERMNKEVERFGLRKGIAVDLEEMKPDGSERWNLDRDGFSVAVGNLGRGETMVGNIFAAVHDVQSFEEIIKSEEAERDRRRRRDAWETRLRRPIRCCKRQARLGGFYLHEHPRDATS